MGSMNIASGTWPRRTSAWRANPNSRLQPRMRPYRPGGEAAMRRAEPIRIETMPTRGADEESRLLREGTRHLIYRGPLRIGEIEETIAVHQNGQQYGFRPGLTAMCLRDIECRYPTALLKARFRTVASAIKAIKHAERQWLERLPKDERHELGQSAKQRPGRAEATRHDRQTTSGANLGPFEGRSPR